MSFNNKRKSNEYNYENDFKRARRLEQCLEQSDNEIVRLKHNNNNLEKKNKVLEKHLNDKNKIIFNLDTNLNKLKEYKKILNGIDTKELFKIFSIHHIEDERYISCLIYKFIKEERNQDIKIFNQIKDLYSKSYDKKSINEDESNINNNIETYKIENTAIDSDHWTKNKN